MGGGGLAEVLKYIITNQRSGELDFHQSNSAFHPTWNGLGVAVRNLPLTERGSRPSPW